MAETLGVRLYPGREATEDEISILDDKIPGSFWKEKNRGWNCVTPNGLHGWLKNHHVEEHEDGMISVVAGSWGSNSILVSNGMGNKSWHGYIVHGVWQEC